LNPGTSTEISVHYLSPEPLALVGTLSGPAQACEQGKSRPCIGAVVALGTLQMGFEEHGPPLSEEAGLVQGEFAGYAPPARVNYGGAGYGSPEEILPLKAGRKSKSLHLLPACVSFLVPWILFLVIYAVTSFSLHYSSPFGCWLLVVIAMLVVCAGYGVTVQTYLKGKSPTWYAFLSTLMLIAVVLAACLGTANYLSNLRPYYDTSNLNRYDSVDPEITSGQQMMDAGQITFVKGVNPDVTKAMGFRDREMYCVTPITKGSNGNHSREYDFWAVGTNCCTGANSDFHCSEYDNKYAHSGLRVVDVEKQAFYRLAVQQAEAAYGIHAPHPIFVSWLQDPNAELDAYADEGMMYYLVGIFSHLAFQVVVVGLGLLVISKFA